MRLISALVLLVFSSTGIAQEELAGDSIYQIGGEWQTQDSRHIELRKLLGKKQVVAMAYTHCEHVCPVILASMKSVEKSLPDEMRNDIGFVLVTFTPDTDTPEVMKEYSRKNELESEAWTLLRGDKNQIRNLAMALGVKYQLLENNEVNHSNLISIVDETGKLTFQGSGSLSEAGKVTEQIINN